MDDETDKRFSYQFLALRQNQGHIWAFCNCRSLLLTEDMANCPLCEVIRYCAGSNGTKISVFCIE